jgi:hypothetical protein
VEAGWKLGREKVFQSDYKCLSLGFCNALIEEKACHLEKSLDFAKAELVSHPLSLPT